MLRLRIVVPLCAALLLTLAAPGAALAEEDPDIISSPTIVSAVVDMETGVPTVTVSVTCLMPAANVRGEGLLTQRYGSGRFAFTYQGGFGGSTCQAGDVLTFPVRFPSWLDGFVPGPAEIDGFMEAQVVCCYFSDDMESIGPTTVRLRPA